MMLFQNATKMISVTKVIKVLSLNAHKGL